MFSPATVNSVIGFLVISGQAIALLLIVSLFSGYPKEVSNFFRKKELLVAFVVALVAMLGSLIYSDILGYEPCKLCWVQRIFLYPQVFLLGMALKKRDRAIIDSVLMLSLIGAVIALYQYLLQLGVAPAIPCSAVGQSLSCAKKFVFLYGYITIPLMAFTAFVLNIALMIHAKKKA